jgi:hypothetical protein
LEHIQRSRIEPTSRLPLFFTLSTLKPLVLMGKFTFAEARYLFCLTVASLLVCGVARAQTVPTPPQTDQIILDNNSNSKADPGDKVRYKVTIQNTGSGNANGVQLNAVPDSRTTLDGTSFRSSPVATNDGPYACTGNVGISISAASGVKANDFDDNLSGATLSVVTSPTNGTVTLNNDGSFTYRPNAGFNGSDQFTYEITDVTAVAGHTPANADIRATVSITVSNMIWFVDNSVTGPGTGTVSDPFNTLAGAATASGTGHVIFVKHTGTSYTGGILLKNNQHLFGTGHTGGANLADAGVLPFTMAANSLALPAINGTRPFVTNSSAGGIMLASGNTIRGLDAGTTASGEYAIRDNGATVGNLSISDAAINNALGGFRAASGGALNVTFSSITATSGGAVNGIFLNNTSGTFNGGTGSISNMVGSAILISGGTVALDYDGSLSKSTPGRLVDIQTHATGAITLDGTLSSTGSSGGILVQGNTSGTISFNGSTKTLSTGANTAVTLSSNTGATINFTNGGLAITTTSGQGFNATGGGTVTVQGTGNTISSTTGTALNVSSTTIGGSGMTFQSISHNGGTNGIVLNATGSSGGLTVTGDGGGSNNGSGGTIQNTTGDGVLLTTVANVKLNYLNLTNNLGDGISGSTINGFQLNRCNITGNGNDAASDESGINVTELTGTAIGGSNPTSITNCTISNNNEFELQITNTTGTLTDFQMSGNTISSNGLPINGNATSPHGNLVNFLALGTANMKMTVTSGSFTGNWNPASPPSTITATAIQCDHSGSDGTMTANISGANFTNNNVAVSISNAIGGNLAFDVNGNIATGNRSHGLNLFISANATGSVNGKFRNNTVGTLGTTGSGSELAFGIRVQNEGSTSTANPVNILIDNNTVQEMADFAGINVNLGIASQSFTRDVQLTITNNTIKEADNSRGIIVQQNNSTAPGTVCANISGNNFTNVAGLIGDGTTIRLRQLSGGTFKVPQANAAAIQAANPCLAGTCPASPGQISIGGTVTFSQPACTQPTN